MHGVVRHRSMTKVTADVQYSHMHPPCTPPGIMSRNRELFHSDMQEKQPPELQIEVRMKQKVTLRIPLGTQREASSPHWKGSTSRPRLDSSKDCPEGFLSGCQNTRNNYFSKKYIFWGLWEISKVTSNGTDDAMSLDIKYYAGI